VFDCGCDDYYNVGMLVVGFYFDMYWNIVCLSYFDIVIIGGGFEVILIVVIKGVASLWLGFVVMYVVMLSVLVSVCWMVSVVCCLLVIMMIVSIWV